MSEMPNTEDIAALCERMRAATPTAEGLAEHMRHIGAVVGVNLAEALAGAEASRLTHDRR